MVGAVQQFLSDANVAAERKDGDEAEDIAKEADNEDGESRGMVSANDDTDVISERTDSISGSIENQRVMEDGS